MIFREIHHTIMKPLDDLNNNVCTQKQEKNEVLPLLFCFHQHEFIECNKFFFFLGMQEYPNHILSSNRKSQNLFDTYPHPHPFLISLTNIPLSQCLPTFYKALEIQYMFLSYLESACLFQPIPFISLPANFSLRYLPYHHPIEKVSTLMAICFRQILKLQFN